MIARGALQMREEKERVFIAAIACRMAKQAGTGPLRQFVTYTAARTADAD